MSSAIQQHFGTTPDGEAVEVFTLQNSAGMRCKILTYGGIISEWSLISNENTRIDVVLGFSELESYLAGHPYFGAITGRVAGRISGGEFYLDGQHYQLAINDPPNHLHGGDVGLDKRVWQVEYAAANSLKLSYLSPDGEEGYPGNVQFTASYRLSEDGELSITHEATTDKATPICLTNHSYFNLAGQGQGDILDHHLQIDALHYSSTDSHGTLLEKKPVKPQDPGNFQCRKSVREALPFIDRKHGDLYFLDQPSEQPHTHPVATLTEPNSGRTLNARTNSKCLQLYLGKYIPENLIGKEGRSYGPFSAICLECHDYPNGVNAPELGDIILHPHQTYSQQIIYHLSN
ncbi:MAG: aldose epimerase family protein [Rubritalea sp.]